MATEERENALHCLKVMIDEEVCEECNLYGTTGTDHCEADCVRVAIEALKEQMSNSEKPNKWIPVSESMPPIGQDVLVCDLDGDMHITHLHLNGTWGFEYCGNKIKNVVAWQELPAPFKSQESEG